MSDTRPNPDELLQRVQAAEQRQARGRLKVFFGMAAGVGKTYAMLEAAQERRAEGVDVVIGWVETHGRSETEALVNGLERFPAREIDYRGTILREFDLDAALARRPRLILMDELAHTNAAGSRHPKRWQDVEELLAAGIDVYTTVNVQHIESLNDVVAQITGVVVRETVPDRLIEAADEVELIDLPPDDLLQRLRGGKVYVPQQAERAAGSFFRKGNLIALRELALRRTADRVDAQMQHYMRDHAIPTVWPTAERILVCVSESPLAPRLVRATRRMATALRAEWIVAYFETPRHARLSDEQRDRVIHTLRLAEQLGAETLSLTGHDVAEAILDLARRRNVSKIVVGKPMKPRWRELLFGSVVGELVRRSGEIDIYVISGEHDDSAPRPLHLPRPTSSSANYGRGVAVMLLCTAVAWLMLPIFELSNVVMVYLLGVVFVAWRYGRGPSIAAAVLGVATFDFFFVPPFLTFAVSDTQYLVTFAVMLVVALIISTLTTRIQQQAEAARGRERRTAALYAMSRDFAATASMDTLLDATIRHISETFDSRVAVLLPGERRALTVAAGEATLVDEDANERGIAQWVLDHGEAAGFGTNTLPGSSTLYVPLTADHITLGVVAVRPSVPQRLLEPEQFHLLETFANQTALAIERGRLAQQTEHARVEIEAERLRSALLSSVSHDLRTPLAIIAGASSTLLADDAALDSATHRELTQTMYDESERLNRLVRNLLDMTRLQGGAVELRREWQPLEEVVGTALGRLEGALAQRRVTVDLPPDLELVPIDGGLIEQVLLNLLENALKYTPPRSPIDVSARPENGAVVVTVADRGPGLPPGDEQRVFDKFYRGGQGGRGSGLGLAICQGIVQTHGGWITAENRAGGGAVFHFSLPLLGTPPRLEAAAHDVSEAPDV